MTLFRTITENARCPTRKKQKMAVLEMTSPWIYRKTTPIVCSIKQAKLHHFIYFCSFRFRYDNFTFNKLKAMSYKSCQKCSSLKKNSKKVKGYTCTCMFMRTECINFTTIYHTPSKMTILKPIIRGIG